MNLTTSSASGALTLDSSRREYWLGRIDRRPTLGAGPSRDSVADESARQLASYLEWLELSVGVSAALADSPGPQAA